MHSRVECGTVRDGTGTSGFTLLTFVAVITPGPLHARVHPASLQEFIGHRLPSALWMPTDELASP